VLVSLLLQCALPASAEGLDRAAIAAFSQQMSARYGFNAESLTATLAQAQRRDTILTTIAKPAEHKPWYVYRPIFMTAERIDAGVRFWTEHAAVLARAEQEHGVPASIIVAIIGVETFYGRNTGNFRVMEALGTLAFHYPPRATFFRAELENFFLLARDENLDALTPTGSYAGAMGLPQFMPSSFRNFAVDFDHDGHRDIWRNPDDAIGSVANYLKQHGWVARQAIVMPVMPGTANAALASDKLELKRTVAQFMAAGVRTFDPVDPELPAVLIAYESKDAAEYWLGFKNFYAITRYNRSPKYALAVAQLADAMVQKRRPASVAKQP
jgi:membrane-bound lytic murein transglycosylase B